MNVVTDKIYVTVNSEDTLRSLYNHIIENDIIAVDTETTSLNPRNGKIIGWSVSGKIGMGFYLPLLVWNHDTSELEKQYINNTDTYEISKKLINLLVGKKLVMHNASFDCRYIKNYFGIDLLPSLWVETILLVHTLDEEGAFLYGKPFALKSIAMKIQEQLGLDIKEEANIEQIELKESIKNNGGEITKTNFEIYKADLDILSKYASADTDLTLRVCLYYLDILAEENLVKFFFEDEVMPVYKEVTIPMEERGILLDLELLNRTKKEIKSDIKKLKNEVLEEIFKIEEAQEWLIYNAYEVSFPPKNRGIFAKEFIKYFNIDMPLDNKGEPRILKKEIETLPESNQKLFLLGEENHGIDEIDLLKISIKLWKESNDGDLINIQSKKHLGDLVFKFMKVDPKTTTKKGSPQFDDNFIADFSKDYAWAEKLRVYNRLVKIYSTYVKRLLTSHEDGIFYPYFKQHGTVSGRYGSDLQQLPKPKEEGDDDPIVIKYNNRVREFFIPRKDYLFIDCDYVSLEPVVFAAVSGDKNLQEIFEKNWDFYSTIAIRTENLKNVSPDKNSENFLKKVNPNKRNEAKAYSLGIPYGMSGYALAKTLGIKTKEGERLRQAYLNGFPQLNNWMEESKETFRKTGLIANMVGRVRHLRRGKHVYDLFGDSIMNYRFRSSLAKQYGSKQATSFYLDYKNAINSCMNFQIQSLAASIVNRAALNINRYMKANGIDGLVIAQIHDQLIMEISKKDIETMKPIIKYEMENVLELPGVQLMAPPEIAKNFREGH